VNASTAWLAASLHSQLDPRRHRLVAPPPDATQTGSSRWDDRGEGVISASIAVLIMAFLGALMWVGFKQMWQNTEQRTDQQVNSISNDR
jgi:hypothetical protein